MYLHKTKNGHYTPPCCYFSGELEVVEILWTGGRRKTGNVLTYFLSPKNEAAQEQLREMEKDVWLTSNIIVQKGVTIGKGSLVTAYTTVNKDVPPHSILAGSSIGKVIKEQVLWGRETCPLE